SHCRLSPKFTLPYPLSQRAVPVALHSRQSPRRTQPACSAVRSALQAWPVFGAPSRSWHVYVLRSLLCSPVRSAVSGRPLYCVRSLWSSPVLCPQSLIIPCAMSASSGHLLYCPLSLVISCTVSAVSGHLLYCPLSLVISCTVSAVSGHLLYCPLSLVIPCTVSAVSGHLLYCVRSLWSSPVLCLQSLVHLLYCVRSLWSSP
ncbi:unnamed protein product, partial [Staurois parvus]